MNKKKETERHLNEARFHLEIAKIYLGGFDDYIECVDVTAAYDLINNIITKYQIKEFEEEIKKEKELEKKKNSPEEVKKRQVIANAKAAKAKAEAKKKADAKKAKVIEENTKLEISRKEKIKGNKVLESMSKSTTAKEED